MKLRWIDLGVTDYRLADAIWEFHRIFPSNDEVTIITLRRDKVVLDRSGLIVDYDDVFYMDKIPEDVKIGQPLLNPGRASGWVWNGLNTLAIFVGGPLGKYHYKKVYSSCMKVYRSRGIKCYLNNNDLIFLDKNNNPKKFASMIGQSWDNEHGIFTIPISYEMNFDLMNEVFRFDTNKFSKKEGFNNKLESILGGLYQINSNLDIQQDTRDIVLEYAKSEGFEMYKDSLKDYEWSRILNLMENLYTDEWLYNRIHPELGEIKVKRVKYCEDCGISKES